MLIYVTYIKQICRNNNNIFISNNMNMNISKLTKMKKNIFSYLIGNINGYTEHLQCNKLQLNIF